MNKQNIWFVTLFSIILILSIYYISIPSNLLEEYDNVYTSDDVSEVINEESSLVALKVQSEEETLATIGNLEEKILDVNSTILEKNEAYESLKNLNQNNSTEYKIEEILKSTFGYDSFVKITKDQVNVVISSNKHDKAIANSIIKTVQNQFDTKKYITVKFQ